jgi:hypothetical protein
MTFNMRQRMEVIVHKNYYKNVQADNISILQYRARRLVNSDRGFEKS